MPDTSHHSTRRDILAVSAATVAATAVAGPAGAQTKDQNAYAEPADGALPASTMRLDLSRAALVVVDPQNDFLHETGVAWPVVGESVTEHNVVDNIESLFKAAKAVDLPVFVSPHHYFPQDHRWEFEGKLEMVMHNIKMFDRTAPLNLEGFDGSGADWLEQYKPYINDGKTVICSPHKIYGPEQNDLALQMRKRRVDQVILAGMSSNLCVESHMRELIELGFEVAVIRDATAGAKVPEGDGYLASLINFRMIANAVWSTDEAVSFLSV